MLLPEQGRSVSQVPSDWEIVRAAILDEEEKRRASDAAAPWLKVEHPSAGNAFLCHSMSIPSSLQLPACFRVA